MRIEISLTVIVAIITLGLWGCSGLSGNPAAPPGTPSGLSSEPTAFVHQTNSNSHTPWGYYLVHVDANRTGYEIIPIRTASDHWNVLKWLENTPCPDCLNITSFETTDYNTLLIDVELIHPFQNYNFTGFDVRGIVIFDGSLWFPEHGLSASDRLQGDGELLNADGYTSLYNSQTIGSGPSGLQGYIKGDMATLHPPDSTVNGFKRYTVPEDGNRNPFYPNEAVTRTFEIDMPDGEFVFGYAVDANWAPPLNKPVTDPLDDFGPEANCPEPWCIRTHGEGILIDGTTTLMIEVFDWQGSTTHSEPVLECPDLFPGTVTAEMIETWSGITRYEVTIENSYNAPLGIYRLLVSVEDEENEFSPPWLDLTAYSLATIEVHDIDPVDLTPPWLNFNPIDIEVDGDYAFTSSNCTGFHIFDITDPANPTWFDWIDIGTRTGMFELNDGYAFITDDSNGLIVADIDPPESASIITTVGIDGYTYEIAISDGYAYLPMMTDGISIVDIDPPESANVVHFIPPDSENELTIGLDAAGSYACACVYTTGGAYSGIVKIIDITDPETAFVVNTIELVELPSGIAMTDGYVYICFYDDDFQIYDIDPPESASLAASFETPGSNTTLGIFDGYAYISDYESGVLIADIDPPSAASIIGTLPADHWISSFVVRDGTAYMANGDIGILVADVEVPSSPSTVNMVQATGNVTQAVVRDGYAYLANRSRFLNIVDIDPPESASIVNTIESPGEIYMIDLDGSYAYATAYDEGLQFIDITSPESAFICGSVATSPYAITVAVADGYAYVDTDNATFDIIDIDPIAEAHVVKTIDSLGEPVDIAISGDFAYLANEWEGMQIVDIDIPSQAHIEKIIGPTGQFDGVSVQNGIAYISKSFGALAFYYVDPPSDAYEYHYLYMPNPYFMMYGLDVCNGYAYVTAGSSVGCTIIDVEPVMSSYVVTSFDTPGSAHDVMVEDGYAYISDRSGGFRIFEL